MNLQVQAWFGIGIGTRSGQFLDCQAQVQVRVSPDLLEFVDAGAATLVAAGAGDGAIEERHQRHHQGQQGGGHLLRQGHRH